MKDSKSDLEAALTRIARLPAWARERMKDLEWQRNDAVRTLNKFVETQQPSRIWFTEHPCIGGGRGPSFKDRFIQSDQITFETPKGKVTVRLRDSGIYINGSTNCLRISPESGNSIFVYLEK